MTSLAVTADVVVRGANVITIDPRLPRAEALAIKDGRFIAVGATDLVNDLVGPCTEVLELPGKTVVPGFIDAHIHVLSSGIRHVMAADCDRRDISSVQQVLRERTRAARPGNGYRASSSTTPRRKRAGSSAATTWMQ